VYVEVFGYPLFVRTPNISTAHEAIIGNGQ
jgi:hypothetical protein